jgi:AcrR family transcriptional regulator
MNRVSSQNRTYELKARAKSEEQTRRRIAKKAAELHEEIGPAATTVAEIARRAGVSRVTVYRHFPDDASLYPACSAHYREQHPLPDLGPPLEIEDPIRQVSAVLRSLYGWYRDCRPMLRNLYRDRGADPALDRFMRGSSDELRAQLVSALAAGFRARGARAKRLATVIRLALHFWTWERLAEDGFDDADAADLMAEVVAGVAGASVGPPPTPT